MLSAEGFGGMNSALRGRGVIGAGLRDRRQIVHAPAACPPLARARGGLSGCAYWPNSVGRGGASCGTVGS